MKKIILLLFFFLLSSNSFSYSFFKIKPSDIKLTPESFRRYAKPQLRSIIKEYFHVIRKISPETESLISLRRDIYSISKITNNFIKNCSRHQENEEVDCSRKIQELSSSLKKYEKNLYTKFEEFSISHGEIEDKLGYQTLLRNLIRLLAGANHHFEEFRILSATDFEKYASNIDDVSRSIQGSVSVINLNINILMPSKLKNEFEKIWSSFILPIEEKVLIANNRKFLTSHLERLNIDWNSFNKNMTKGNYNISMNKIKVTKIMHNRWNAVLKLILRK
jgi:hypothetical protein